jgi:Tol biopolymer transport system component
MSPKFFKHNPAACRSSYDREGYMPEIGQSLSHYSITGKIGKGGMGEVYQAKDQKLGRDVAIKVLPEEFARDADRVARFQREAKLLASLNHPNIAAIYGLEESAGTSFLVLELVEGDTLANQIKRGPIPVEEALKLALQIAEALEAAHEKGVIHRDLKPANIKVTPDGKVKVLDFGLAKAFAGEQAAQNLSNSPTLSDMATMQGVILGTASYMSPEQARGKPVDKRADVWAFGCVLFEMLTDRAAFWGEDVSEILASVIKGDLQLNLLPEDLHPRVREVIIRCLQKEQSKRYRDIGDAHYEIEKVLSDPGGVSAQPTAAAEPRTRLRKIIPWAATALVLGLIVAGAAVWKLRAPEARQVMRFDYDLPDGQQFSNLMFPVLAVSPDGKQFVYSTSKGLLLRSVDELNAKLISGTEADTQQPFFSPDGKWIGYFSVADQKLKKIPIIGGSSVALCDVSLLAGASWGEDNTIIYATLMGGAIRRINANGGTPETIIKAKSGMALMPQILPDGGSVLYTAGPPSTALMKIMVQPLNAGEPKELLTGMNARYLPTGHIVYQLADSENLFAIPFDLERLEVAGGPIPIVEGVFISTGVRQYAVSNSGTLVYMPGGGATAPTRTLVWVNRDGEEEPLAAPANVYAYPKISPDGTRVALTVAADGSDIWIWDFTRETLTRLTFDRKGSIQPVWTPDGRRIVYRSLREGLMGSVYWKASDGTGEDEKLASAPDRSLLPYSWSSDGNTLVMGEIGNAIFDIGILAVEGDRARKPLLQNGVQPQISPDGRWIAYASGESGQNEVYVRPFPEVNKGKWQVSTSGGSSPIWSPDGRELFYISNENSVMATAVTTKPAFSLGTPKALFRSKYVSPNTTDSGTPWDIGPDGKRFLMIKSAADAGPRKINIVLNWFEELKQRVPVK